MLSDRDVEVLAEAAYRRYLPASPGAAHAWEQLDERERHANRDSVRFAPVILAALGLTLRPADRPAVVPMALTEEEVEAGARLEHLRWARFTRRTGRPDHPDLRPWWQLSERTRQQDRVRVRDLPELTPLVGLRVVREGG
ncbi:hypothetical protein PU560_17490 [Georgenia sp. 10Sc9-8]|uniref:Uncharacterized protein n=1 Tax=Georgenia halotolerans TaxID=3028317 RepID=A0ABT5U497_9MICO|nr:hypothetical protein [Georgenia halotolerans]